MTMSTFNSLEIWTSQTLCNAGIFLSVFSFLLHIGWPYFERIPGSFSVRVAADLWRMVYVTFRDGSLLFAVLLGLFSLNLDVMADIKMGLPFVPLGTVALSIALVVKAFHKTKDQTRSLRVSTYWVICGALLNMIGYVLVMEAPVAEYDEARNAFWKMMRSCSSRENPELATMTFYATFLTLILIGGYAAIKAIRLYGKVEKIGTRDIHA
jgi:hypothetical protein